ncbi:hypothetical protein MRX96_055871 [Rhipicephalus microplus]
MGPVSGVAAAATKCRPTCPFQGRVPTGACSVPLYRNPSHAPPCSVTGSPVPLPNPSARHASLGARGGTNAGHPHSHRCNPQLFPRTVKSGRTDKTKRNEQRRVDATLSLWLCTCWDH